MNIGGFPSVKFSYLCQAACEDEGRVAEHYLQEAPQDRKAADRDVQERGLSLRCVSPTEYGVKWRQEISCRF